jgi:hypothetical protein
MVKKYAPVRPRPTIGGPKPRPKPRKTFDVDCEHAMAMGTEAAASGFSIRDNPFSADSALHLCWARGFAIGKADKRR